MENCLFCKIVAGEIPASIIYQDNTVLAFKDIHPQAPQHILLIPREHVAASAADIQQEQAPLLANIFIAARNIARELGIEQSGYRLVTNVGPDSGQTVFHLHFHLLGGAPLGLFGTPSASS